MYKKFTHKVQLNRNINDFNFLLYLFFVYIIIHFQLDCSLGYIMQTFISCLLFCWLKLIIYTYNIANFNITGIFLHKFQFPNIN